MLRIPRSNTSVISVRIKPFLPFGCSEIRKGCFICMACNVSGGDVLAFHMKRYGLEFIEAANESDFLDAFHASRSESIARTIDASPVASALIEWFDKRGRQTTVLPVGTLFNQVELSRPNNCENWPRSAKGFGDALRRAAPALRQIGIECRSLGKIGSHILWEIKTCE